MGRRKPPAVRQFMTRLPAELDRREPVSMAIKLLTEQNFHHLPIMDGPRLYGVVTSRELDLVATAADANKLAVGDVCQREPYTVSPTAPVSEVAKAMADRHLGSAVIVDDGVVVGIFTTTDALRALVAIYEG